MTIQDILPAAQTLLVNGIIPFVSQVLIGLAPVAVAIVGALVYKKFGFQLSADKAAQLDGLLEKGILFAESKAAALAKSQLPAPKGDEKLTQAVDYVLAELKRHGLDQMAKDKVVDLVQAKFGQVAVAVDLSKLHE